jgi:hypothetical protein
MSEKAIMDYFTLEGFKSRTGVEEDQAVQFIVKELLDNALDFIERHALLQNKKVGGAGRGAAAAARDRYTHDVKVFISKEKSYLKLKVLNLNFGVQGFTKEMLDSIFTFEGYLGSKRKQHRIKRGTFGDAFKEIVGLSYGFVDKYNIKDWNEPLIIKSVNKQFTIQIQLDRIEGKVKRVVQETALAVSSDFTEIEIHVPFIKTMMEMSEVKQQLFEYALINTHIGFQFEIQESLFSYSGAKNGSDDRHHTTTTKTPRQHVLKYDLKRLQNLNPKWKNTSRQVLY